MVAAIELESDVQEICKKQDIACIFNTFVCYSDAPCVVRGTWHCDEHYCVVKRHATVVINLITFNIHPGKLEVRFELLGGINARDHTVIDLCCGPELVDFKLMFCNKQHTCGLHSLVLMCSMKKLQTCSWPCIEKLEHTEVWLDM